MDQIREHIFILQIKYQYNNKSQNKYKIKCFSNCVIFVVATTLIGSQTSCPNVPPASPLFLPSMK